MSTEQQEQRQRKTRERKQLQERRFIIISVAILLLVGATILWILNSQGIIRGSWSGILLIIFTVAGIIIGLFQWLYPLSSPPSQAQPHAATAATMPAQQIIVHVPPTASTPSLPAPLERAPYRGIVGVPPPTDPRTIQQRQKAVQDIYSRLLRQDITAIALTGIAGVGKSTLAALVYRYAEEQRRAGSGIFTAESLWLNVDSSVTMADLAGNLFEALHQPMPDFANLSLQNQALALFNALNAAEDERLIIFDQFENLLDWQSGHALADRPGVGEWIDAINSQPCRCRILLTTRLWPQGTREYPPTYMQEYFVRGLEVNEGIELLRKLGVEADEQGLRTVVERCAGHAFALALLASLLRNRHLSLETFFQDPTYAQLWSGNIARNLLDYIYKQQLDATQRRLLFAFSIYREPVPLHAAQAIIEESETVAKVQSDLDTLLSQHLLQAAGEGNYQLHAIVANYAQGHFIEGDERANRAALQAAHVKAAQYYLKQAETHYPPPKKRQHMSDLEPLIEAIWQYCQAEQWQEAYRLMEDNSIYRNLKNWGGDAILLELYTLLLPPEKWQAERLQAAHIYNNLGVLYRALGRMQQAREYIERALRIYEKEGNRVDESWSLNHLGRVYSQIGNKEQARAYYEQALRICQEEGDQPGEATALNNLGWVCNALGQTEQEQKYYEQALSIFREIRDRGGEGSTLNNLGRVLNDLGQHAKAQEYYEQALRNFRETNNLRGEGWTLSNLGKTYYVQGQLEEAHTYLEQALRIRREVDRRGAGRTLNNLGAVYASMGQGEQARACYEGALSINRAMGDREGEGKTLRNFGRLYLAERNYSIALAALLLAQRLLDELQSPYRYSAQEGLDALRQEIGEKQFADLRTKVEPQAPQIVKEALG
jgi:tetratricopeptide (TPR) repeat protein